MNLDTWDAEVDALADHFERRYDCDRCRDTGQDGDRRCYKCDAHDRVEPTERHTYSCDRCGDMGYYSASGSWSADDDVPCSDCRAIGYESSPYGPDGDWGPES